MGVIGVCLKRLGFVRKAAVVFHGYDISRYLVEHGDHAYDQILSESDLVMPVSRHWREKLIQLGCEERKIVVHRMGVDVDGFRFRERRPMPGEDVKIVSVGRLIEKKGHEYVIRAVGRLINEGKGITCVIVGDGPLREQLEALAGELRVAERVVFKGAMTAERLADLYESGHLFVLPSVTSREGDQEGIPVVLMEAQALGLPVVSTYHSGIPELVIDGETGLLVPERDVGALYVALKGLIENPSRWAALARGARQHVEEHYDIRTLNDRLEAMLTDLVTEFCDLENRLRPEPCRASLEI